MDVCHYKSSLHWAKLDNSIVLLHSNFPLAVSSPNTVYYLMGYKNHCRLYINISQILLLYKTWRYYSKFDSPKSLGICYCSASCWLQYEVILAFFFIYVIIGSGKVWHREGDKPLPKPLLTKNPAIWRHYTTKHWRLVNNSLFIIDAYIHRNFPLCFPKNMS